MHIFISVLWMKKIFIARIISALFSEQKSEGKFRGNWTTQQEFQESQGCTDAARKVSGSDTHYILMNWWMCTAVTCGYLVRFYSARLIHQLNTSTSGSFCCRSCWDNAYCKLPKIGSVPCLITRQRIPRSMASDAKMIVKVVGGIMTCFWKGCGKWQRTPNNTQ